MKIRRSMRGDVRKDERIMAIIEDVKSITPNDLVNCSAKVLMRLFKAMGHLAVDIQCYLLVRIKQSIGGKTQDKLRQ